MFSLRNKKIIFQYALLSGGLYVYFNDIYAFLTSFDKWFSVNTRYMHRVLFRVNKVFFFLPQQLLSP